MKSLYSAAFGSIAGALLSTSALLIAEPLMPLPSAANTNVRNMLNNADMAFGMGDTETACLSVSVAIQSTGPMMDSQFGATTSSQKADLSRYAKRCGLRY